MFKLLTAAIFVTTTCVAAVSAQSDTCRACNCQFNNVQVLDQLIEDKIAAAMEAQTGTPNVIGVTYTRWGSTSCSNSTGAQLVYAGRAGGSRQTQSGGGAEKLCLPNDPDYLPGTAGIIHGSQIYGAEYQFHGGPNTVINVHNHNVPCAVCYVPTRVTAIMVPAKTLCPPSWTREYYGYLTTEFTGNDGRHRSSYNCVDVNPEVIPGTSADVNVALLYFLSAGCNLTGLACPPYENDRVLSCAVCTK